jgi:hypothetical protein
MATNYADFGMQYGIQKRNLASNRDTALQQNAYSRFLAQQRGSRSFVDLERNMTRGLEKLGSGYGRRGLRNSGIFGQAQNDYAQNWVQGRNDIQMDMTAALRDADFGDANAWGQYNMGAADVDQMKAAQIMSTAATLDQFKPFLGS